MSQIIVLGRWLELADDTYETSRREMFKRISEKNLLHVPAYLLHWSVELYLKAFLLHHDAFVRGHNLNTLFIRCLAIDQRLNDISFRNDEVPFDQKYWIEKINIYGENGLYALVLVAQKNNWQLFDTSLGEMIDLKNPANNGYQKFQDYVRYIQGL